MNVILFYIIESGSLFYSVVLKVEMPSSDIPAAQKSILLRSMKKSL